jgi:hypothetical protein
VLASAALRAGASEGTPERSCIVLDVAGNRVFLDSEQVLRLRDAAADRAGRSSTARDLSLLLDRVLQGRGVLALHRGEAHSLADLAIGIGLLALADQVAASVP